MSTFKKVIQKIYKGEAVKTTVDREVAIKTNWNSIRTIVSAPTGKTEKASGRVTPPNKSNPSKKAQ